MRQSCLLNYRQARLLNYHDASLYKQINVAISTMNHRRQSISSLTNQNTYTRHSSVKDKLNRNNDVCDNEVGLQIAELENLNEMQRDGIRRFVMSPVSLEYVSKPSKLLFQSEKSEMTVSQTGVQVNNNAFPKLVINSQLDDKHNLIQNFVKYKQQSFTRRDFILTELTNQTKSTHVLGSSILNISLGVRPKYYQKWARNKKSACKYSFPSLTPTFRTDERCRRRESRECYKGNCQSRKYQGKERRYDTKTMNNANAFTTKVRTTIIDDDDDADYDMSDYYLENDMCDIFERYESDEEDTFSSSDESDYADSSQESNIDAGGKSKIHAFADFDSGNDDGLNGNAQSNIYVNKCVADFNTIPEDTFDTLLPCANDSVKCNGKPDSLGKEKDRINNRGYAPLSTKEISTRLLDQVLLPVMNPNRSRKHKDSVSLACRRILGFPIAMSEKKINKATAMHVDYIHEQEPDQHKPHPAISDSVQNFRYKRTNARTSCDYSDSPSKQNKSNRVPANIAEVSLRYTEPDNVNVEHKCDSKKKASNRVQAKCAEPNQRNSGQEHLNADFEPATYPNAHNRVPVNMTEVSLRYTGPDNRNAHNVALRATAHLQRLHTSLNSDRVDINTLRSSRTNERVSFTDKNDFKTISFGCVVK